MLETSTKPTTTQQEDTSLENVAMPAVQLTASEQLAKRALDSIDKNDFTEFVEKLADFNDIPTLEEYVQKHTAQIACTIQMRPDGYVQDYSNVITTLHSSCEFMTFYHDSPKRHLVEKQLNRIADVDKHLISYEEYLDNHQGLVKSATADALMDTIGLEMTNQELIEFINPAKVAEINKHTLFLKTQLDQLDRDESGIPTTSENNLEIFATLAKSIAANRNDQGELFT